MRRSCRRSPAAWARSSRNRSVMQLPLNGRSYLPLVALVPGVALPPGSAFPRLNGGRPRVNEYLYDGISVLQPEPGTVPYFPIIDAIQEFKVVTNSPPAEFGRFNGGVINLSTKAGSNELHGAAFGFLRNEALNARNLFAPKHGRQPRQAGVPPPPVRLRPGGPDREGPRRSSSPTTRERGRDIERVRISTVPTALQRQGIFTEPVAGRVPTILRSGHDATRSRRRRRPAIRFRATPSRPAASTPWPPSSSAAIRCPTSRDRQQLPARRQRGHRPGPVRRPRRPPAVRRATSSSRASATSAT